MQHTPTFFIHLLRHCQSDESITQVMPTSDNRWNDWVFATKTGCPYMVFERNGIRFSVSRVRKGKTPWSYLMRWPYPSSTQNKYWSHCSGEIVAKILKESEPLSPMFTWYKNFDTDEIIGDDEYSERLYSNESIEDFVEIDPITREACE